MSTENKVFKMSLDVTNLISNYKKAISTMQNIGGPDKAITTFEQTLRKLETEFSNLQKMGTQGIAKDPSSVNSYTKAVEKAYKRLSQLGDEMAKLGKNSGAFNINGVKELQRQIDGLNKEAKELQKNFSDALRNAGFSKETANTIAGEVKTRDQLVERLERELRLRQQIQRTAREVQTQAVADARTAASKSIANIIRPTTTSSEGLTSGAMAAINNAFSGNKNDIDAYLSRLNVALSNGVVRGRQFQETWDEVVHSLQRTTQINDSSQIFKSVENIKQQIEVAYSKAEAAENRQTSKTAEALSNASQRTTELFNIINQVRSGSSELNTALTNVVAKENEVANATNQMAAAEQRDAQQKKQLEDETKNLTAATNAKANADRKSIQAMRETSAEIKKTESAISRFAHMIGSMFSIYTIFSSIRSEIRKTYEDIKTLDKSFASIAMVTSKTVQDMWATYDQYASMAAELGQKTNSVIEASALFYQQG